MWLGHHCPPLVLERDQPRHVGRFPTRFASRDCVQQRLVYAPQPGAMRPTEAVRLVTEVVLEVQPIAVDEAAAVEEGVPRPRHLAHLKQVEEV